MPNRDTFKVKPILDFVRRYALPGLVGIDPFARNTQIATFTNDLNPGTSAKCHLEAADFLRQLVDQNKAGSLADYVLFDPPYSLEQCKRSYESVHRKVTMRDTQVWRRWTEHKDLIAFLLKPGGVVLSFGWDSCGMGKKRGFVLEDVLLVCHGSGHNDTICIAERKPI
jgi:hypothetical protein